MTTVMTWGNSSGTRGRCDAKCHNAKGDKCKCMCGGRYHGKNHQPGGIEMAVQQDWEQAIQEAEARAKEQGATLNTARLQKMAGANVQTKLKL